MSPEASSEDSAQPQAVEWTAVTDSPVRRWTRRLIWTISIVLIATALLPLLPVDWWWIRIGDYPRVQLLIAYLFGLSALAAFWRHTTTKALLGLLAVSIGIQVVCIFPYLPIAPHQVEWAEQDEESSRIRILTANVLQENKNADAVLSLVETHRPDLVVLLEVNDRWIGDLQPLNEYFDFHLSHPLENKYGIAMYTNLKVLQAKVRGLVKAEIPSIDAVIELQSGHRVRLFAVHPNPPRPGEDTTKRDAELVLVGREVQHDPSVIVLGDMNDVGWSRTTNLFQEISGLLDPRKGRGLYSTFDATSAIWRYPLDYLFHSDDFRVAELKTLPDIGSDHFPLLVELSHEPDATDEQEAPDLDAGDREDADDAVEKLNQKPLDEG